MATRCNDVDLNRTNFRSDQFPIESSSTDLHNPPTSQFASVIEKRTSIAAHALDDNNIRIVGGGVQPLLLLSPQNSCVNHETSTPSNSMTSSSFSHQTTLTAAEASRPSLGGLSATISEDDENDGFRTPTSGDHIIPERRPCPPAPRKVKNNDRVMMMSTTTAGNRFTAVKRKIIDCSFEEDGDNNEFNRYRRWGTSSSSCRVLLDLSGEVEAMFPAAIRANFGSKIKKARSV